MVEEVLASLTNAICAIDDIQCVPYSCSLSSLSPSSLGVPSKTQSIKTDTFPLFPTLSFLKTLLEKNRKAANLTLCCVLKIGLPEQLLIFFVWIRV